jgi:hypothetical protein
VAEALGDRGEDVLEEAGAPPRVADVVAASPEPGAVDRPRDVEPEEVGEDELHAQARLAERLDRRLHVREDAVVEPRHATLAVLAQPGPPVAEQPPADERGPALREAEERPPEALAALGPGEAAAGLPGVRPEVLPVVEPGQVRPDDELTHSA